jgi:hypothetical protein
MFYGATDALADANYAASSYQSSVSANRGSNLLTCYGFLQALYVQQDAVITLSRALSLSWHPSNNQRLKHIRDVRNRLAGHPALAGERETPRRLSAAIIGLDSITSAGFQGHIYFEDGFESIDVNVASFRRDNEELLSRQMLEVERKMDEEEREFRQKESKQLLSRRFDSPFSYLMQRLWSDLTDDARVVQARSHAQQIQKIVIEFQDEIDHRGFSSEGIVHHIRLVLTGISLLEAILDGDHATLERQDEFDLIHDGVEKNVAKIIMYASEIDRKLCTPIPNHNA